MNSDDISKIIASITTMTEKTLDKLNGQTISGAVPPALISGLPHSFRLLVVAISSIIFTIIGVIGFVICYLFYMMPNNIALVHTGYICISVIILSIIIMIFSCRFLFNKKTMSTP